jgi:hypothetical protein
MEQLTAGANYFHRDRNKPMQVGLVSENTFRILSIRRPSRENTVYGEFSGFSPPWGAAG